MIFKILKNLSLIQDPTTCCCCSDAADAAGAADAADAADAAVDAATAAEAALQYLQGVGIRTRDSATADRCATTHPHICNMDESHGYDRIRIPATYY